VRRHFWLLAPLFSFEWHLLLPFTLSWLSLPWVAVHNFCRVLKFKLEESESTVGVSVPLVFKRAVGV
jgi:hypothetical protein